MEQIECVFTWIGLIALYYPKGRTGRPSFTLEIMLLGIVCSILKVQRLAC